MLFMNFGDKKYQGVFHLGAIFLLPVLIVGIGLTGNFLFLIPLLLVVLIVGIIFVRKSKK